MAMARRISRAIWRSVTGSWPNAGWEETDLEQVTEFAHKILESPMELMTGVAETLARWRERHELTLFTKGDPEEQKSKIDRSGLRALLRPLRGREGEERDGLPVAGG